MDDEYCCSVSTSYGVLVVTLTRLVSLDALLSLTDGGKPGAANVGRRVISDNQGEGVHCSNGIRKPDCPLLAHL